MILAPPPPPLVVAVQAQLAPPTFSLPARGRTTIKFKVTCAADCAIDAEFTVDRPTAKRLGLGRKLTAGSLVDTAPTGKTEFTLRLVKKAKNAVLNSAKGESFLGRLKVTATYDDMTTASGSRQVRLRK